MTADPVSGPGPRRRRFTLRGSDVGRMLVGWATGAVALIVAAALLPGLDAESWLDLVAVAAVMAVFGALVRPVLSSVAARLGWFAVAAAAVAGEAVTMALVLLVVPGVEVESFWTLVAATWIAASVSTLLTWLVHAGTDEAFATALWRYGERGTTVADPEVDGVVFVQLDGLPFPVAQWAVQSGTMPTLRRWLDQGSHRLLEWTVQMPCTTPASQQGLLHGTVEGVPAFRWFDRELGRVLVANRPADAAVIESRASTGHGLLADRGASVSNLFSGDAGRCMMTMSQVSLKRGSVETRRTVARFVARPDGFSRSVSRTVGEVVRERFQARQQRRRNVVPRVSRPWTFALLRAVTNGVLRDLNTAVVAQEMMKGTPSIYVDYVDYDEVAHHAGGNRLEALRVLQALDEVVALLERLGERTPRRYHFVVLSDHGQSQGGSFAETYGQSLAELCQELCGVEVASLEGHVESWGRVEPLLDDLAGEDSRSEHAAARAASRVSRHAATAGGDVGSEDLVVLGSGNLGLVYATGSERLYLEDIEERWPYLITGLAAHPGVGFIAVLSRHNGPVAIGSDGYHRLRDGAVQGTDPLAPFGDHAAWAVRRCTTMPSAPDIYVNSVVSPSTLEVAAFEGLVGSHGGLGGWQDRGSLLAPTLMVTGEDRLRGADAVHERLVGFLEQLGQRRTLSPGTDVPAPAIARPSRFRRHHAH
ncbi:MAG: phage holin family protein [Nocardioidaceae bacterium]